MIIFSLVAVIVLTGISSGNTCEFNLCLRCSEIKLIVHPVSTNIYIFKEFTQPKIWLLYGLKSMLSLLASVALFTEYMKKLGCSEYFSLVLTSSILFVGTPPSEI